MTEELRIIILLAIVAVGVGKIVYDAISFANKSSHGKGGHK